MENSTLIEYYKISVVPQNRRNDIVLYTGEIASKALSMAFQNEKIMDFERDFSKFPIVKITVSFFENITIDAFLELGLVKRVLENNYIILEEWGKP
jgi:hypothetical protein